MKRLSAYLLFFAILGFGVATSDSLIAKPKYSKEKELCQHVEFLASDSLKGRFPGTPESKAAATYIFNKLRSYGYTPLADNGIQQFDMTMTKGLGKRNVLSINGVGCKLGTDFTTLSISSNGNFEAKIDFVGYGLYVNEEGLERNEYQDVNIRGKWAMMLMGVPNGKYASYSGYQQKAVIAKERGAIGVIFVAEADSSGNGELMSFAKREVNVGIPCIQVSRKLANELLSGENTTLEMVEENLANNENRISYELGVVASAEAEVESAKITGANIVMMLKGSNTSLDESIVIGAHYDHLGFGGVGSGSRRPQEHAVHNGADDNASGVALLLQLAEQLALQKELLKRNIVVVAFDAEEQGIVGSKYFVANVPKEAGKPVTMLNFDMVGRLNDKQVLQISGVGTFNGGEELVRSISNPNKLSLTLSKGGFGPSDHSAFYAKQIPVLYFTTGVHTDYHTPDDDSDKINCKGMAYICNFADKLAMKLATQPTAPVYQHAGDSEMDNRPMKVFKVTLGIIPDFMSSGSDGMRADVVSEGKPAYRAGMKSGDVIVGINKKTVHNIQDYMLRLSELKAGDIAEVEVLRGKERIVLYVQL